MSETRADILARLEAAKARHAAYMAEASQMPTPPDAHASPHCRAVQLAAQQLTAFDRGAS